MPLTSKIASGHIWYLKVKPINLSYSIRNILHIQFTPDVLYLKIFVLYISKVMRIQYKFRKQKNKTSNKIYHRSLFNKGTCKTIIEKLTPNSTFSLDWMKSENSLFKVVLMETSVNIRCSLLVNS